MQERQTTSVVYTFRMTRSTLAVGLLGLLALVVGFVAPAQAGDNTGKGRTDKPWICHPVEGKGETGTGWSLIAPAQASKHIDESTGAGFHTRRDGRTDVYAVGSRGNWTCPGAPGTTTTTTPGTTTTTIPGTMTTTTSGTTTTSTTAPTTTESPDTGATTPAVTTTSRPVAAPTSPEEAAFAPSRPEVVSPAEQPAVGALAPNAVPQAATDGADLVSAGTGWGSLRLGLLAAGGLMVLASGLLSLRRRRTF